MSLSIAAIAAGIASNIKGIAEGALTIIKVSVSVAAAAIFAAAILTLLGFVQNIVYTSVVGEVLGILSVCLPFSPAVVFGSIFLIFGAIIAFLVARKIYLLTSHLIGVSS